MLKLSRPAGRFPAQEFFHALDPAAVGRYVHFFGFEDDGVFALALEMEHHFSGARRSVGGALQLGKHLIRGALEIDADADAGRQLDLHFFQRLDAADGDLGRGVFFLHDAAANEHRRLDLELRAEPLVVAREADQVDLAAGVFERGLGVELLIALALLHAQAVDDAGHLDFVAGIAVFAPAAFGGLRSQASEIGITAGRLRSFSAYLSSGWPETKKPSTSFSLASRSLSSQSATWGRSSALMAIRGRFVEQAEQAGLAQLGVALRFLRALHGFFDRLIERGARAHANRARRP